jgi:hypothetical protein
VDSNGRLLNKVDDMTAPLSNGFGFERLESRVLLAVEAFQKGATLYVVGDDADDHVQLDGNGDSLTVRADNGFEAEFTGVQSVRVILGGGDDTLDVGVESGFDISGSLFVDSGLGNDAVQIANTTAGLIFVSLGTGDDSLSVSNTQLTGWLVAIDDASGTVEIDPDSGTPISNGPITVVLPTSAEESPEPGTIDNPFDDLLPESDGQPVVLDFELTRIEDSELFDLNDVPGVTRF